MSIFLFHACFHISSLICLMISFYKYDMHVDCLKERDLLLVCPNVIVQVLCLKSYFLKMHSIIIYGKYNLHVLLISFDKG